jgi:hypothetical protein
MNEFEVHKYTVNKAPVFKARTSEDWEKHLFLVATTVCNQNALCVRVEACV